MHLTIINIIPFLLKVINRFSVFFHISKSELRRIAYRLLSIKVEVNSSSVELNNDDCDLKLLFNRVPHREYRGCLCTNSIEEKYDLQVVVPAYNVEQYIEKCIDSIINQKTKFTFIVVIINDGSTDNTRKKLAKYERLSNVIIIDQKNRGFSGARNTGIQYIRSRYVAFVDSDDILAENAIENLMNAASYSNADVVEGSYVKLHDGIEERELIHGSLVTENWLGVVSGYPWGKVIRSSLLRNLHFPECYWFEDTMLSFLLYSLGDRFQTIPEVVYCYRSNPCGITASSSGNPKVIDSLLVSLQCLEDAKCLGIKMSGSLYDMFLQQVLMNYNRIHTLKSPSLDRLVFKITCRVRQQYFPLEHTDKVDLKPLEDCLVDHDFGKYLAYCMIR